MLLGCPTGGCPSLFSYRIADTIDEEWEIDPNDLDIQEKLGEGEFGTVHLAYWNGTRVAVKILRKSDEVAIGDFRTELNILSKVRVSPCTAGRTPALFCLPSGCGLPPPYKDPTIPSSQVHHPHAVQFLGACTKTQPYMLVTEFMCGGSLADFYRTGRRVSLRRACEVGDPVALALHPLTDLLVSDFFSSAAALWETDRAGHRAGNQLPALPQAPGHHPPGPQAGKSDDCGKSLQG